MNYILGAHTNPARGLSADESLSIRLLETDSSTTKKASFRCLRVVEEIYGEAGWISFGISRQTKTNKKLDRTLGP
ncbi:hypothetical protein Mapa_001425 [Marchantia paleacea]|nr:hypothetical protein Mapa_001425 [Marchantia paleacea]